ncbi:cadmium, cobalt and zinc/H(+)-K(+) antiporter [Pedobacter glucosidilyticus]|nr:cation transporter [Pedobacter glucosidilyticus]KHJ38128.1 cadmium, cobalt and zinc/H(+)-K(+) antiporter [Pedobacter glucosidilyticus]
MNKTSFYIEKMDCPSEEQIIRMKLEDFPTIKSLNFDIPNRKLVVYHEDDAIDIHQQLDSLHFNTSLIETTVAEELVLPLAQEVDKKLLWIVLLINFALFLIEIIAGLIADSMGLLADSLDMLADSLVYSLALFAIGKSIIFKKNIAKTSGYLQLLLAIWGFVEVIKRFYGLENLPHVHIMILISLLALLGNAACLYVLQKSRSKEAHMQASMIFTSNDVVVNIGVILAALMVYFTQSPYPDLIIGAIVFIIVARGAFRILNLSKA